MSAVTAMSGGGQSTGFAIGTPLPACVFCGAQEAFTSVPFGVPSLPEGVTWPASHCFQGKTIAICGSCGGGFVREIMRDEDISAFYASIYDARHTADAPTVDSLNEVYPRFFAQTLYLKSIIDLWDGMRILEVGPNFVSALPALSLFCRPRYYYFDQLDSKIIAHYGGQRLGAYADGREIVRRLGEHSLDLIYASHSLEHVNPFSLEELFRGVALAVAPGGHVFAEVPDDLAINLLIPPHTLFFTEASLRRLFGRHGLEIVDFGRWGTRVDGARSDDRAAGRPISAAPARSSIRRAIKGTVRKMVFATPPLARRVRPLLLQRAVLKALRDIPTPYEPTPYFRVIARKP